MKKELELNEVEINKIEFSHSIIDIFNKYKEIANMFFSVDDYIFTLSLPDSNSCSYIKEKTSLNKIGFIALNQLSNLQDNSINNILTSNQSKITISNTIHKDYDKYQACLFHIISIGQSLLIKSHMDNYPFEPIFPGQLILSDNMESLLNHKYGCPILNNYLIDNEIEYLLEDYYMNEILDCIKNVEQKQCSRYPLIKLGSKNRQTFKTKRFCFFRDTLDSDILSFFGIELSSKLRARELSDKLTLKESSYDFIKKKI